MERAQLEKLARDWAAADPDEKTAAEVRALLDKSDVAALEDRFGAQLEFGTAGVGSSRVDLQACKLEYSIVSPK